MNGGRQKITAVERSARIRHQIDQLKARIELPDGELQVRLVDTLQSLLAELEAAELDRARQYHELTLVREALIVERHRYRELFELAPFGYLVTDASGVVLEANLAASALLRCSRKALQGKPLPSLLQFRDRKGFRQLLLELQIQRGPLETELELRPRTAAPRWIVLTGYRDERDESRPEQPRRVRWMLRDVTGERAAEEALQAGRG